MDIKSKVILIAGMYVDRTVLIFQECTYIIEQSLRKSSTTSKVHHRYVSNDLRREITNVCAVKQCASNRRHSGLSADRYGTTRTLRLRNGTHASGYVTRCMLGAPHYAVPVDGLTEFVFIAVVDK